MWGITGSGPHCADYRGLYRGRRITSHDQFSRYPRPVEYIRAGLKQSIYRTISLCLARKACITYGICPGSRPRTDRGHLLLSPRGGYTEIRGRCRRTVPGLPPTKPEGRLKAGYPRLLRPPRPGPLQPGAGSPRASRRVVHDRPGRDSDPESFTVRAIEVSRDFARYSPIVRPWPEGDTRRPLPRRLRRQRHR